MDINIAEGFERIKNDFIYLQREFALTITERDNKIHLLREENLELRKKIAFFNKQIDFLLADESSPKRKAVQIGKCLINIDWSKTGNSSEAEWSLKKADNDAPGDISQANIRTILRLSGKRKAKPAFSILSTGSSSDSSRDPIAPTLLSSDSNVTTAASSVGLSSASAAAAGSRVPTISGSSNASSASETEPAFKYRCPMERRSALMPNLLSLVQENGALTPGEASSTALMPSNTNQSTLNSTAAAFNAVPTGGGHSNSRSGTDSSTSSSAPFHRPVTQTQAPGFVSNSAYALTLQQPPPAHPYATAADAQHTHFAFPAHQHQHLWSAAPPFYGTMPMQPFDLLAPSNVAHQPMPSTRPSSATSRLGQPMPATRLSSAISGPGQPMSATRPCSATSGPGQPMPAMCPSSATSGPGQPMPAMCPSSATSGPGQPMSAMRPSSATSGLGQPMPAMCPSSATSGPGQPMPAMRLSSATSGPGQPMSAMRPSSATSGPGQQQDNINTGMFLQPPLANLVHKHSDMQSARRSQQQPAGGTSSYSTGSVQAAADSVATGTVPSASNPVAVPEISADVLESLWASINDELPLLEKLNSASGSNSDVSTTAAMSASSIPLGEVAAPSHVPAQPLNYSEALEVMVPPATLPQRTTTSGVDYLAMLRVMKESRMQRAGDAAASTATDNSDPSQAFLLPFSVPANSAFTNTENNNSSSTSSGSSSNMTDRMLPVQSWHQPKDSSLRAKVVENILRKLQQDQGAPLTTEAAIHRQRSVMKFEQVTYYSSKAKMEYVGAIAKAVRLSSIS